jgi:RNA polymerase sigma factor (sigma-70 family)
MSRVGQSPVCRYLYKTFRATASGTLTDEALLARYCAGRDEAAFELLVWRHGTMVMSVCRRVLQDVHHAEDAFQATFLTLARKADSIGKGEALSCWLYRVASRIAFRARKRVSRRQEREQSLYGRPEVSASTALESQELRPVLDEEVNRLPIKYRSPIVLCYLEGKTHAQAAQQLGWAKGTVSGRLARARDLLRSRLLRRGLALASVLSASTAAAPPASALVPAALVDTTVKLALLFAAGKITTARLLSQQATVLAEGCLRTMFMSKLRIALVGMIAVLILGAGAGLLGRSLLHAQPPARNATLARREAAQDRPAPEQTRSAVEKAVRFLKSQEREGSWEQGPLARYNGGLTSLALLGLLEAGCELDDPAIRRGLQHLRNVEPEFNYVVALQTMVFCRASAREDKERIQRNVDYLLTGAIRDNGHFRGWSYHKQTAPAGDNSNTQYAIMALDAASAAGIAIDKKLWREIRDFYVQTQLADGGWTYSSAEGAHPTLSMTCAGLSGLLVARKHEKDKDAALDGAVAKGLRYLGENFRLDLAGNRFYLLHALSRSGRLAEKKMLPEKEKDQEHDWYAEGTQLLLKTQEVNGSWEEKPAGTEPPVVATSFALLFLGKPK